MGLHRPYIRQDVREEVERRAQKNENGQFLDANTGKPIEGKYDLGHKAGHEFYREAERAESEGLTQEEFNEQMNNPDLYQIEDPHENRSHAHEMTDEDAHENENNDGNTMADETSARSEASTDSSSADTENADTNYESGETYESSDGNEAAAEM